MRNFWIASEGDVYRVRPDKVIAVLLFLFLIFWALPALSEGWEVTAKSFVIMDAKTGKTLLALNPRKMLPPASTIKTMTAMYVMESLDLDDKVGVSRYAASAPASKIYIKPGEVYTVKELLYALLLSSANDGARALAERVSGTERDFAWELTQKVRQWGAYRTRLETANGLTKENQYSTAEDLAILFQRFTDNPILATIMGTKYYQIRGGRELRNHDRFLFTTPLAVGGKTGYTRASKHTYVGRFRNGKREIIVSMMGSKKKWADLRVLIEKGFALSGTPIAKLEPKEEKLWFVKKHRGKYAKKSKRYKRRKKSKRSKRYKKARSRKKAKVMRGSSTSLPKKTIVIKGTKKTIRTGS